MLGDHELARVHPKGSFGPGLGPVWLDDLQCNGNEGSLSECAHFPWGQTNCDHREDAAVTCRERREGVVVSDGTIGMHNTHCFGRYGLYFPFPCPATSKTVPSTISPTVESYSGFFWI